jgi:hypothetical protein
MTAPAIRWRKSSFSDPDGTCVALAEVEGGIAVRNTNRPEDPPLVLSRRQVAGLLAAIKAGALDDLS